MLEKIYETVLGYSKQLEFNDDITMIGLEVKEIN